MKSVFVITTALGLLQSRLIIQNQNIALDDVVLLTLENFNEMYYNLYFKDTGVTRVFLKDDWLCLSQYYGPAPDIIPSEYYQHAQGLINKIEAVTQGADLSVFVPNVDGAQFVLVANYLKCKQLSIYEEGSSSYVVTDLDETDTSLAFAQYLEQHPELVYEKSGICTYEPRRNHDIECLINPFVGTAQNPIIFYRFSDLAFREKVNSSKAVKFINYGIDEIIGSNDHTSLLPAFVQAYKYYLDTLAQPTATTDHLPTNIQTDNQANTQINLPTTMQANFSLPIWAVDACFPSIASVDQYQTISGSLLAEIKQLWGGKCNFVAVKLHPNIVKGTERYQVIVDLLKASGLNYAFLSNNFSIDQELCLYPAQTISVFSVTSSLLLYAKIFNQNAYTGHELTIKSPFWIGWMLFHGFNMKELLTEITNTKHLKTNLVTQLQELVFKHNNHNRDSQDNTSNTVNTSNTDNTDKTVNKDHAYSIGNNLELFLNQNLINHTYDLANITVEQAQFILNTLQTKSQAYFAKQKTFIENLEQLTLGSVEEFNLNQQALVTNLNGLVSSENLAKDSEVPTSERDCSDCSQLQPTDLAKFLVFMKQAYYRQLQPAQKQVKTVFYLESEQAITTFYQIIKFKALDLTQVLVVVTDHKLLELYPQLKQINHLDCSELVAQLENTNSYRNYYEYTEVAKAFQVLVLDKLQFNSFNLVVESLNTELVFVLSACYNCQGLSVLATSFGLGDDKDFGYQQLQTKYKNYRSIFRYLMSPKDYLNQEYILDDIYSCVDLELNPGIKLKGKYYLFAH